MKAIKSLVINNLDFALLAQKISGDIPLDALQRLSRSLLLTDKQANSELPAKIQYTLAGAANRYNLPSLHLSVDADLPATCQRCLDKMHIKLKLNFDYLISDTEPAEYEASDDYEWLETTKEMDVWELIEDELLMALPIAPLHSAESQGECVQLSRESGEKPNPFAVLKDFVRKPG